MKPAPGVRKIKSNLLVNFEVRTTTLTNKHYSRSALSRTSSDCCSLRMSRMLSSVHQHSESGADSK
jgi:hypothetical protein